MVRASMNESRQRRANAPDDPFGVIGGSARGRVLGLESMPGGYERTPEFAAALRSQRIDDALRALPPNAPVAAALDGQPWAASWGRFLSAIRDDRDAQGARKAIRQVVEARPRNALGERVPSEGGFLVPWKLVTRVLAYVTPGIMRRRAMQVTMDTLRVGLPTVDNPSSAGGAQVLGGMTFSLIEEGAAFPATTPSFGQVVLEARKIGGYLASVPNELLADATPFTEDFLPRVIALGLDWYIDDLCIFSGTGVGQPQALLVSPAQVAVSRVNSGQAPVHADVVAMLKAAHPASMDNLTWLMGKSVFDALLELYEIVGTAPSGQQIPPPQTLLFDAQLNCWRLLGVPAFANDHQPAAGSAGDLMLCDLSQYALGALEWMTVEVSSKGSGFANDTSSIRVRTRLDGRMWPQSPFTMPSGQTNSPLAVLH